jgi:uncharacterized protein (DUF2384 family)
MEHAEGSAAGAGNGSDDRHELDEKVVSAVRSGDFSRLMSALVEWNRELEAARERRQNSPDPPIDDRAAGDENAPDSAAVRTYDASRNMPGISFLIHQPSPMDELAAIVRGLPAAAWRSLEHAGYSRDEISAVVGNSPKTIRRKEKREEPLDLAEGDRTMRLMRITVEAADAFATKARRWRGCAAQTLPCLERRRWR